MGRSAGKSWTGGGAKMHSPSSKAKKRRRSSKGSKGVVSSLFVNADDGVVSSPNRNNNHNNNKTKKNTSSPKFAFPRFSELDERNNNNNNKPGGKKSKNSSISKLKTPPPYPSSPPTPPSKKNKKKKPIINLNDYVKQQKALKQQQSAKKRKRGSAMDNHLYDNNNNAVTRGFALQLPCKHAGKQVSQIPWMANDASPSKTMAVETPRDNNTKTQKRVRLPTDDVDPAWLDHLNAELLQFAEYVRLTPTERQARLLLVNQITQICQGISNFDACPDEIVLEPFGSFAAPEVCTFDSDVDLALWGAVSILPSAKRKLQKQQQQQLQQTSSANTKADEKRQRLQKWHRALAQLDEENNLSPGNHDNNHVDSSYSEEGENDSKEEEEEEEEEKKKSAATCQAENEDAKESKKLSTTAKCNHDNDDDDDDIETLFVIDRNGDHVHDDQTAGEGCPLTPPRTDAANKEKTPPDATSAETPNLAPDAGSGSSDENDGDEPVPTNKESSSGGSFDAAIEIHDDVESDSDNADKLEGLKGRPPQASDAPQQSTRNDNKTATLEHWITLSSDSSSHGDNDEDEACVEERYKDELAGVPFGNHHHGEDDDEEDDDNEAYSNMEVGYINGHSSSAPSSRFLREEISPEVRKRDAVDALSQLDRRLRRSKMTLSIQFIRHARVPIIKFVSKLGVEVDISIGGQNGADTSLYAAQQTRRYKSFAPVVLALKILMGQQDLDKPFTGGLGSFKLYVLVAYHIQQHLRLGGVDQPGEILLGFLFRYGGNATGDHCVPTQRTKTFLSQDGQQVVCEDTGCDADLSNVFKLEECCHLFGSVWRRLWARMRKTSTNDKEKQFPSLLAELVHADRLAQTRSQSHKSATNTTLTSKVPSKGKPKSHNLHLSQRSSSWPTDKTASQLAAGYGVGFSTERRPSKRAKT